MTNMEFDYFHKYNTLVRRGYAQPLLCYACNEPYVLTIDKDDSPALECYYCGGFILPGLRMYQDIVAVVKEHFI